MFQLHIAAQGRKSLPRNIDTDCYLVCFAKRHRLPLRLAALIAELAGITAVVR